VLLLRHVEVVLLLLLLLLLRWVRLLRLRRLRGEALLLLRVLRLLLLRRRAKDGAEVLLCGEHVALRELGWWLGRRSGEGAVAGATLRCGEHGEGAVHARSGGGDWRSGLAGAVRRRWHDVG
jgi:hypothetical protein